MFILRVAECPSLSPYPVGGLSLSSSLKDITCFSCIVAQPSFSCPVVSLAEGEEVERMMCTFVHVV